MHLTAARTAFTIAIIAMIVALGAASSLTSSAAAQQDSPPHAFFGTVLIDGRPASQGTVISAYVDGVRINSSIVDASGEFQYLEIFASGKEVSFTIGELIALINNPRKGINQAPALTAISGELDILELTSSETSFNQQAITSRQILFDLYYATRGVNWRNTTNWPEPGTPRNLARCHHRPGGVTEFRLSNNRLRGSIPSYWVTSRA